MTLFVPHPDVLYNQVVSAQTVVVSHTKSLIFTVRFFYLFGVMSLSVFVQFSPDSSPVTCLCYRSQ